MTIFIDSANLEEVRWAREQGWIGGVTTNPLLIAKQAAAFAAAAFHPAGGPAETILRGIVSAGFTSVFYQLGAESLEGMKREEDMAASIVGSGLVIKLPPSKLGLTYARLRSHDQPSCITAVYSAAQAAVAMEAGARYVAIYLSRANKLGRDGVKLIRDAAQVLQGSETEILAASIKSTQEAEAALLAGARHLTLGAEVLAALNEDSLSSIAIAEFHEKGKGLIVPAPK